VSEPNNPQSVDFEEASSKLGEGLKSCRAVLSGYRALLGGSADSDEVNGGNSSESDGRMESSNDG